MSKYRTTVRTDAVATFQRDEFGLDAGKSYGFSNSLTGRDAPNLIQGCHDIARQREAGRREVLAQVTHRRGAGNEQNVGCALQ